MKTRKHRFQKSFTLIELLVVVAIISILASIALPNFQHAQVKARVTAAQAEMMSLATAVEAYQMDHNTYPLDGNDHFNKTEDMFDQQRVQMVLTTPTAYISEVPGDDFHNKNVTFYDPLVTRYFLSRPPYPYVYISKDSFMVNRGVPKAYYLFSLGPDIDFDNHSSRPEDYLIYDPSNGVISDGDILRKGP
ncbi:MAG: prepilin-type N-terminal cleavage/methylation domain-containing protein [Candidatus Hinthialibacter sp.]